MESRRDVSGSKIDDIFSPTRSKDFLTDNYIDNVKRSLRHI
jgi:hypothetical protein